MEPESPGMEFFQQAVERRRAKNLKRNKKRRTFMEQFLEHAIIRCYRVTLANLCRVKMTLLVWVV